MPVGTVKRLVFINLPTSYIKRGKEILFYRVPDIISRVEEYWLRRI